MPTWTPWRPFPDPRTGGILSAPIGPGVYELRNRATGQLLICGIGGHCAARMSSLLPAPLGCGGRNNSDKRAYLRRQLRSIEYRTRPCTTRAEAAGIERDLLQTRSYRFNT